MKTLIATALVVVIGVCFIPRVASAQRVGIRGGITDDPDTAFFGGHLAFHPRGAPRLRIEPSFELGVGDIGAFDVITLRGNLNFKFAFPISHQAAFFPLIGPALYFVHFDDCTGDCEETDVGVNLGFGFAFNQMALEFALGLGNNGFDELPDVTLTFSYTF